jgi:molecular chaperone GrpE (heat shock protein)
MGRGHTDEGEEPVERARREGAQRALEPFLDVVDDCDRALEHVGPGQDDVGAGIEQLRRRLLDGFTHAGYEPFCEVGDAFDPSLHEALSVEAGLGEEGSVLRVHRRGWCCEDRLVRAASVTVVQSGPESPRRQRRFRLPADEEDGEGMDAPYEDDDETGEGVGS